MNNKVAENPFKNRVDEVKGERLKVKGDEIKGKNTSFIVVTALFVTLYVVSNVMAVKVIGLWDLFYFSFASSARFVEVGLCSKNV